MNYDRIQELRASLRAEAISYGELAEIQAAFDEIPDSELPEARENAMASDMLDELTKQRIAELQDFVDDVHADEELNAVLDARAELADFRTNFQTG